MTAKGQRMRANVERKSAEGSYGIGNLYGDVQCEPSEAKMEAVKLRNLVAPKRLDVSKKLKVIIRRFCHSEIGALIACTAELRIQFQEV